MPDREEWIEALNQGVERFRALRDEQKENPDLSGADLSGHDLSGAPLDRANLSGADLRNADLSGATLGFTDLSNADLRGANLVNAMLHRTTLVGTDFRGCQLGGFDAGGRICLHQASFKGVRWGKEELETMLAVLNANEDWEIRYEVVPRR